MEIFSAELLSAIELSRRHYVKENVAFLGELLLDSNESDHHLFLAEEFFSVREFESSMKAAKLAKGERADFIFALAAIETRKDELAIPILERLSDEFSLYHLGLIYERQKKWGQARNCFAESYDKNSLLIPSLIRRTEMERRVRCSSMSVESPFGVLQQEDSITISDMRNSIRAKREIPESSPKNSKLKSQSSRFLVPREQVSLFPPLLEEKSAEPKRKASKRVKEPRSLIRKVEDISKPDLSTFLGLLQEPMAAFAKDQYPETESLILKLPSSLRSTRISSCYLGKCAMFRGKNREADQFFSRIPPEDPYAKEYHSSVLWSLGSTQKLLNVSAKLEQSKILDHRTWITLANCYSALDDHVAASHFISRALLLAPNDGYTHCISGHELFYLGNHLAAEKAYKMSTSLDPCEANAFWGLGNIALKSDRPQRAANYFKRALLANPGNSLIHTYYGIAMADQLRFEEALDAFSASERIDGSSTVNSFHKASTLYQARRYKEALHETRDLCESLRDEPKVFTLLAQIYFKLGEYQKSHQTCMKVLDMDPEDTSKKVKALLQQLNSRNEEPAIFTETPLHKR